MKLFQRFLCFLLCILLAESSQLAPVVLQALQQASRITPKNLNVRASQPQLLHQHYDDYDKSDIKPDLTGVPRKMPLTPQQKTLVPGPTLRDKRNKQWWVVDADGLRLGRMASQVAKILLGKDKFWYEPGADIGDHVVIVNAEKVAISGKKSKQKIYRRHSGRPGGMKTRSYAEMQKLFPERIIEKAIVGMLPRNTHGRELFRHVKVYAGPDHPHAANKPKELTFGGLVSTPLDAAGLR
jgi:large subunit ribosomal protein L13